MMAWDERSCLGRPLHTFFETAWDDELQAPRPGLARARQICRGCPAAAECWDRHNGEMKWGVFWGATPPERRSARRKKLSRREALASVGIEE